MADRADDNPEEWAGRQPRRDGVSSPGTSGAARGRSGKALGAWLAVLALLGLNVFVNVTTQLDDARRNGTRVPISLPLTLEMTSACAAVLAAAIVSAAVRLAPPGRGPIWRTIGIHLGGSLLFSATHVGLMTLLRTLVFAAVGKIYPWSPQELPYEYRKDLLAYVVIGGIFWLLARRAPPAPTELAGISRVDAASPATFDIRDGASLLRIPVAEILAAKAAGNYVEFALEDGRRPLMRASMAQIEASLGPHGFVRAHRSWLVNAARVRALSATGAGDFRVDLGCGLVVPASRRYPDAVAQFRGDA
jgi:hypothetical protein